MSGWEFWVMAVIAAVLTGIGKGGVPIVGALTVPVLSLVISPVAAAGLMLPVYVISDWFALYAYRKEFDKRVLLIACVSMTVGVGLGWATARLIPEAAVTVLVGVISVAFALNQLLRKPVTAVARRAEWGSGLFWCSIAGFKDRQRGHERRRIQRRQPPASHIRERCVDRRPYPERESEPIFNSGC